MSVREWLQAELKQLKEEAKVWSKWTETGIRPHPNTHTANHSAKKAKKRAA